MSVSAFNDDEFAVTENPKEKGTDELLGNGPKKYKRTDDSEALGPRKKKQDVDDSKTSSKTEQSKPSVLPNAALRAIATRTALLDSKEAAPHYQTHELRPPVRRQRAQKGPDRFPFRSMRKLARRGGVKRISKRALDAAMKYGEDFAKKVVELAIAYLDSGKRQTCRTSDVLQAFRVMGCSLYGADISSLGSS